MEYGEHLSQKTKEELIEMILGASKGTRIAETGLEMKIAIKMCYDGCRYSGLASQKGKRTVEDMLKLAFVRSGLAKSNVQIVFAGRTDKKVSASEMVCSVVVQSLKGKKWEESKGGEDTGFLSNVKKGQHNGISEFNYDKILNTHLPHDIRILGWCPVPMEFCARRSCNLRIYKYYFLPKGLEIARMKEACTIIRSGKSFHNLSKKPTKKEIQSIPDLEKHFHRPMVDLSIEEHSGYCVVHASSISFLHNMIRKIFWLLKEVGMGRKNLNFVRCVLSSSPYKCGTARPEFLVFSGTKYSPELKFHSSNKSFVAFEDVFVKSLILQDVVSKICNSSSTGPS